MAIRFFFALILVFLLQIYGSAYCEGKITFFSFLFFEGIFCKIFYSENHSKSPRKRSERNLTLLKLDADTCTHVEVYLNSENS